MTFSRERTLYRVNHFTKDFKKLSKNIKFEVWEIVKILSKDVFDENLDIKKLVGYNDIWRVKVGRDWRLVFTFDEVSVTLLRIAHRKDIYKFSFPD